MIKTDQKEIKLEKQKENYKKKAEEVKIRNSLTSFTPKL